MIRLRTLGECAIEVGERRVGPEAGHVFGLLLYLCIERGKHVSRGTLVEHFWPGASDEKGRHCLRQTLYKVRLLGAPAEATPSHVELDAAAVTGDFLQLAEGGRVDVERLRVGGASFGEFLPGYAPAFSPAFADWLESKRDFVHSQVRRALSNALVECRSAHRWADVDAVARHCLQLDPLNEEATLALAEATALTGSKAQALSMLDRFVAELGPDAGDIRLPATLLRKRIAERLPTRHYSAASEALFVGRDADLALLGGLFRDVRAGQSQSCVVWGAPGIGKSRLAAECAKAAVLQGARVQRVGCQASDSVRPLSVFVDVVPRLQAMPGALGCSPESLAYLRRLTEHDGKATPSEEAQEAAYLHARIRRALLDLLDAIVEEAPLVLLVEDVHWLDPLSWEVLREMIEWAAERRIFFLFTSRTASPTEQPSPRLPRRLVTHHLGALDAAASASLLDAIVSDHKRALSPDFRDWCVGVSEGNPLFLRELASQWIETGDPSKVPATLTAVIGERLSRLRPASMRLLQASAILGKNSTFERLEAVTDYKKFELLDSVEELEAAGLLVAGGSGVQVRHVLIANAALQQINEGVKRLLHRNAARVLEAEIEETKSAALLWDYTAHCRVAGEPGRVVAIIAAVGNHLIDVGLPAEAVSIFERAAEHTSVPETQRIYLLRSLAHAALLAGLWEKRKATLAAIIAAEASLNPTLFRHTTTEIDLLESEWRSGMPLFGVQIGALDCVEDQSAESEHRLAAGVIALIIADMRGDVATMQRVYATMSSVASPGQRPVRNELMCDMIFHSTCGDVDAACRSAEKLIEHERNYGSPMTLTRALRNAWIPLFRSGRFGEAATVTLEAHSISEKHRFAATATACAEEMGILALERGDLAEASRWYVEGLRWWGNIEDPVFVQGVAYLGARIAAMEGDWPLAKNRLLIQYEEALVDEHARRRAAHVALWGLIHIMSGRDSVHPTLMDTMITVHRETRDLGGHDFNMYCLAKSLLAKGENAAAYSSLEEYAASYRRETSPLPTYLRGLRGRSPQNAVDTTK